MKNSFSFLCGTTYIGDKSADKVNNDTNLNNVGNSTDKLQDFPHSNVQNVHIVSPIVKSSIRNSNYKVSENEPSNRVSVVRSLIRNISFLMDYLKGEDGLTSVLSQINLKGIMEGIAFCLFFFGLVGATAFVEPINETIIEMRGK